MAASNDEMSHHLMEIGAILVEVTDRICELKEELAEREALVTPADPATGRLLHSLQQAEITLNRKAEIILSTVMHDDVHVLPPTSATPSSTGAVRLPSLSPSPIHTSNQALDNLGHSDLSLSDVQLSRSGSRATDLHPPTLGRPPAPHTGKTSALSRSASGALSDVSHVPGLYTPPANTLIPRHGGGAAGPASRPIRPNLVDVMTMERAAVTRQQLRERFGMPFRRPEEPVVAGTRQVGGKATVTQGKKTAAAVNTTAIPAATRSAAGDPYDPPEITEDDVKRGVYSLVNRGLLPSSVDVGPAFQEGVACVTQTPMQFHDRKQLATRKEITHSASDSTFITNVKFDFSKREPLSRRTRPPARRPAGATPAGAGAAAAAASAGAGSAPGSESSKTAVESTPEPATRGKMLTLTDGLMMPEPSPAATAVDVTKVAFDEFALHQFIIRRGKVLDQTPEFRGFQIAYTSRWGAIAGLIHQLEAIMFEFNVETAFIDGHVLAQIANDELAATNVPLDTLKKCIANIDQIGAKLLDRHNIQRSKDTAATAIQATYRMFACRRFFLARCRLIDCSDVIKRAWRGYAAFKSTRQLLRGRQEKENSVWNNMQDDFRRDWPQIQKGRRVEIHLPSFSALPIIRDRRTNHDLKQNLQLARLCVLRDPLVEVVYVAPFSLAGDVISYYKRMLSIGTDGAEVASRFKIVVPENMTRFPSTLSLASHVFYSPRCLSRIRNFIGTKPAYIVPHRAGPEDKRISMWLGIPLLHGDPAVSATLSTKSGAKRVFAAADVNSAPGAHDVFDHDEFLVTLTALVAAHIDASRWLFKIDPQSGGCGTAYLDVGKIKTVRTLREERDAEVVRIPDFWGRPDVQEDVRARLAPVLAKTLPRRTVICQPSQYSDWEDFAAHFAELGGVIEVVPPKIIGSPSVNLFLSPTGDVQLISTQDQLFAAPYVYAGCSFPAQSVPHVALKGASEAIGRELSDSGMMGYVGIDFVSFWDPRMKAQRIWAVDVNLGMTSSCASFLLFDYLTRGKLDPETGMYYCGAGKGVAPPVTVGVDPVPSTLDPEGSSLVPTPSVEFVPKNRRSFVSHEYIFHPNLSSLQLPAFFNLCRLASVAFDVTRSVGTAFTLVDGLSCGIIGLLCVDRSPKASLAQILNSLTFIGDQVGIKSHSREFDEEEGNFPDIVANTRQRAKAMGVEMPSKKSVSKEP